MNATLKNIFFRIIALFPTNMDGRASVLMYHSVSSQQKYFFTVTPKEFRAQMQFLKDKLYSVIALDELLSRMEKHTLSGKEIVITFDDGYKDNFLQAFPVLKEFGFPATIFISTGLVGKVDDDAGAMLSEEDIKEMHASGLVAIEPHTVTHAKLTRIDSESARKEILDSKMYIEQLLGKHCNYFAYPYGSYNEEVATIVRSLGFLAAVTVEEGTVTHEMNHFLLKRNSIDRLTTWTQFCGKLSRAIDWYHQLRAHNYSR